MVKVDLVHNPEFKEGLADLKPRYFGEVEADLDYPDGPIRVPVYWRRTARPAAPEAYRVEVFGYLVERANPLVLRKEVARAVWLFTWRRRLPAYLIVVPGEALVPAYPAGDGLEAPVDGGPVFAAGDIGTLAVGVRRYLGAIGVKARPIVGRVSPRDLRLEGPVAVLFGPDDVWVPVFREGRGLVCRWRGLLLGGEGYTGPEGLLALRRELAARLGNRPLVVSLPSAEDLGRVEAGCRPTGLSLAAASNGSRLNLRVWRFGSEYVVCHPEALTVHVGATPEELRTQLNAWADRQTGGPVPAAVGGGDRRGG
jgi:hypothetical protein